MRSTFVYRGLLALVLAALAMPCAAWAEEKGAAEKAGAAIDRGLENTKEYLSDSAVTARVKKRLLQDPKVSGFDVKVSTQDGVVTLTGDLESEESVARVLAITRATEGVKQAVNRMMIVIRAPSTSR